MTFLDIITKECEFKTAWAAGVFLVVCGPRSVGGGRTEIAGVTADLLGLVVVELTAYRDWNLPN